MAVPSQAVADRLGLSPREALTVRHDSLRDPVQSIESLSKQPRSGTIC